MSYQVLARKYRSRTFEELMGQEHVVQALANALTQQRLHHAYLFTGTRGVGKTSVSRILAKSLNCLGPDGQGGITAHPCGVCDACRDIDAGRFVDYVELDAASNRGVEEISQLLDQSVYKPVVGRYKVYMIDEVHMLSNTAFNAMLKTLEEPPDYLKFVLATTDPQKVPVTVLSRCLQFNLRPMAPQTVLEHLTKVLNIEQVPAEPGALRLLARAARGSMRDALSLTDQAIAFGSGELKEAGVRQMLGSVDRGHVVGILQALVAGDGAALVGASDRLRNMGLSAGGTLEDLAVALQHLAVAQAAPGALDASDPDLAELLPLAGQLPPDEIQLMYSMALHGRQELPLAPDEYAGLTMVLLRMMAFRPEGGAPRGAGLPDGGAKPTGVTGGAGATGATGAASGSGATGAAGASGTGVGPSARGVQGGASMGGHAGAPVAPRGAVHASDTAGATTPTTVPGSPAASTTGSAEPATTAATETSAASAPSMADASSAPTSTSTSTPTSASASASASASGATLGVDSKGEAGISGAHHEAQAQANTDAAADMRSGATSTASQQHAAAGSDGAAGSYEGSLPSRESIASSESAGAAGLNGSTEPTEPTEPTQPAKPIEADSGPSTQAAAEGSQRSDTPAAAPSAADVPPWEDAPLPTEAERAQAAHTEARGSRGHAAATPAATPVAPTAAAAATPAAAAAPARASTEGTGASPSPSQGSRSGPLRAAPAGAPATRFSDRLRPRAAPVQSAEPAEPVEPPEDLSPPHDDDGAPPWLDVPPPSDEEMSVGSSMLDDDLDHDLAMGGEGGAHGGARGQAGEGIYLSTAVEEVTLVPTASGERWAELVPQLGLNALARELALQAECLSIDDQASPQRWCFRVERESLRQPALQDKLQAALSAHLNTPVQLDIEPGRATDSPALRDTMAARARQRRAETIILEDPEVQQLLAQFKTARILPGSIKPL